MMYPYCFEEKLRPLSIKPFLDAFEKELGHEKTMEITKKVVQELAREQGKEYAKMFGRNDAEALHEQEEAWTANDALEIESKVTDATYLSKQSSAAPMWICMRGLA